MTHLDVYRDPDGAGYLPDCQAGLLATPNTRLVVPLLPLDRAPVAAARLNLVFEVGGRPHAMMRHFATAVPATMLGHPILSMGVERFTVTNAWDTLLTGII